MKKLYVGLVALSIVSNSIAMEPYRARNRLVQPVLYRHDVIGQAYQRINQIIRNTFPFGVTNWKAIFDILDSTPNIDINKYNTPDEETLLEYALEEKNFVAAKRLLQQYNADPHRVVHQGDKTPLQIARQLEHEAGAHEIITLLEEYGNASEAEEYGNVSEDSGNVSGQ